ncbi:MAG: SMP-30/gluconolactonase/LRE family protein [Treponema sp.]|nr:SMP-30/gluconolactonase/LRE family protein [Treponema sp.]
MKIYKAEVFSGQKYQLGESPFYDNRTSLLSWVDITQGKFFTLSKNGEKCFYDINQPIGAAVPSKNPGSYVIAASDGLYLLDTNSKNSSAILIQDLRPYFEPFQRSNDAKADSAGRLWFGSSVKDNHEACGNLFCLDKIIEKEKSSDSSEFKISCRQANTKIANGMAWSRDHKKFYFSDSLEHAVFSYDYDFTSGEISNRQILFNVENGVSDGMCIDDQDNLWVAIWGGHRIEKRNTKNGSLLAKVDVDAENVTSCCFMGDDLDTLFITTSGNDLTGQYDGCLFNCKVDARGLPCDICKI